MTINEIPALFDSADLSDLTDDDYLLPEDWQDYEEERQIASEELDDCGGEDAYLDSYWESLYE